MNVAYRLIEMAKRIPENIAIAEPIRVHREPLRDASGKRVYKTITFQELDRKSDLVAAALQRSGIRPGMKIALMVRQGIDFITLVYALFKVGATLVMIDPGMGIGKMLRCLRQVDLNGFVAIPSVHAVRSLLGSWFPSAKHNLTVGRRLFWGGLSYRKIMAGDWSGAVLTEVSAEDPAAIIFTSGSTGIAKGVLYTHRMIDTQVGLIQDRYQILPGDVDLAGFPFFGLFNAAMGTTAVIPDMDPTRPAQVDPALFLEAAQDWQITQSFGSPALWNRVIRYCLVHQKRFSTLRRAISAGAPVSFALLENFQKCLPEGAEIFTPYGATESLPVASISAKEVLEETADKTRHGAGICVGKKFDRLEWRVLPITDEPLLELEKVEPLPDGAIGELTVTGPQVSPRYVTRVEANSYAKIFDKQGRIWHRIGDVGYRDAQGRFWFCGRKSHRVETVHGPLFTIPCEAIANEHPQIFRSALVGVSLKSSSNRSSKMKATESGLPASESPTSLKSGNSNASISAHSSSSKPLQEPVLIVEPLPEFFPDTESAREKLIQEVLQLTSHSGITSTIRQILIHPSFPVDVRHNAKINREKLAIWAQKELR